MEKDAGEFVKIKSGKFKKQITDMMGDNEEIVKGLEDKRLVDALIALRALGYDEKVAKNFLLNIDVIYPETTADDIVKFGMIPEFVGRFPTWVALEELTLTNLISILTEIKNSFVDQYK